MTRRRVGARTIEVVEEGSGTPVVFLHGNQVDHRDLMVALDPLFEREAGYRRLHLDLPGYGASPPDPTIVGSDGMLEAALELIDGLVGNASFLLVGCSWGGYLARGVVARWPERIPGVALVCPVVVAERSARDLPPLVVRSSDEHLFDGAPLDDAAAFREAAVIVGERPWRHFQTAIAPALGAADPATVARIESAYAFREDVDAIGEPYPGPSLLVAARGDSVVGARDAIRLLPRFPLATVAFLDAAGHHALTERPALIAALVSDWLARVEMWASDPGRARAP